MKRIFKPLAITISILVSLTSCLDEDDSYYYTTTYEDAAITSFTLGTLNRVMHTKTSSGEDSTYVTTYDASGYRFNIDQKNNVIYNGDSLPVGTDITKIVCNITSKNSGVIVIKDMESDTLRYYSSTDSIDFSEARQISVYSTDGEISRAYTVRIGVHNEVADSFKWSLNAVNEQLASLQGMKAVSKGDSLYVFGTDGDSTLVYAINADNGTEWSQLATSVTLAAEAYKGMTLANGAFYTISNGMLMKSADAMTWEQTASTTATRILGASGSKIYAIDNGNILATSDEGATWTAETLDGNADMMPTQEINMICTPLRTNKDANYLMLAGNRSADTYAADTAAVVWGKVDETYPNAISHSWMEYGYNSKHVLPRMENLCITTYDNTLIAIGGDGIGECKEEGLTSIYASKDNGLVWRKYELVSLPDEMISSKKVFAMTSDRFNYLWIICGESGQVWKGRLNRLGWADNDNVFTE